MSEHDMPARPARRPRWLLAAGALLLGAFVTLMLVRRSQGDPLGEKEDMVGMEGMEGMEGMGKMEGMDRGSGPTVQLSAADLRNLGVTYAVAERRVIEHNVRASGVVDFDETRVASVTLKFGGFIERLHADFTGQAVRRGQPLLDIYSPALVSAQEELLLAQRLEPSPGAAMIPGIPSSSTDLVGAARRRLALLDVPHAVIEEVLSSGRVRRTFTFRSPVTGVVTERSVLAGQAVEAGEMLFRVADVSRVWVRAELREMDAALANVGAAVEVRPGPSSDRVYRGRVEYVQPTLRDQTRTIEARITLDNTDGSLKPGMYAAVDIRGPRREALTVPASALVRTGESTLVFVDMGGGRIMPHDVVTGAITGDQAEIVSGLAAGDRVVVSAQFLIDSESNLAEVMRSMLMQMGTSDMGSMPGMEAPHGADMRGMEGMTAPARRR